MMLQATLEESNMQMMRSTGAVPPGTEWEALPYMHNTDECLEEHADICNLLDQRSWERVNDLMECLPENAYQHRPTYRPEPNDD